MGSGHRSGRPEGRTAPPRAPGNRHGGGQDRRAQQQRAEPTGRAAEEAFHHPANEPARDEKQTQPDPHQRIHQLQQGSGVSKAVEREEGLQGHHANPASHRTPQVRHVIMGSLARHGFGPKRVCHKHLFLDRMTPNFGGGRSRPSLSPASEAQGPFQSG